MRKILNEFKKFALLYLDHSPQGDPLPGMNGRP
jgi:hypothetical protein